MTSTSEIAGDPRPVGVFDSGVGGLTVLRALRARLPAERLIYLGDTARVPYGTKAPETVRRYAVNVTELLIERDCKAIVIACNTASAFALEAVSAHVAVPVIDVIRPVASAVAVSSTHGRIGVLGTRGTVASGAYLRALARIGRPLHVAQQSCPLFVPLAEEGWTSGEVPTRVAERYLADLLARESLDSLVLGCTHYPLLRDVIADVVGRCSPTPVRIHDSAEHTADCVARKLAADGLAAAAAGDGSLGFLVTDDPGAFAEVGGAFLGQAIEGAEHVDV